MLHEASEFACCSHESKMMHTVMYMYIVLKRLGYCVGLGTVSFCGNTCVNSETTYMYMYMYICSLVRVKIKGSGRTVMRALLASDVRECHI